MSIAPHQQDTLFIPDIGNEPGVDAGVARIAGETALGGVVALNNDGLRPAVVLNGVESPFGREFVAKLTQAIADRDNRQRQKGYGNDKLYIDGKVYKGPGHYIAVHQLKLPEAERYLILDHFLPKSPDNSDEIAEQPYYWDPQMAAANDNTYRD